MIGEWQNPWEIETPEGTLPLNQPLNTGSESDLRWILNPKKCSVVVPARVTEDDLPQGDGKIPHRRWRGGVLLRVALEPVVWTSDEEQDCASGEDLVDMLDLLGLHLNAMIRTGLVPGSPNARVIFTPSGHGARMIDRAQLLEGPTATLEGELGGVEVEVAIDSAYPYYLSETETQTDVTEASVETITNEGNIDQKPVVRVYGPYSAFTLQNNSVEDLGGNPLQLVYDDSLPGAVAVANGDYVEFDFFRGTAYLNGDVARRLAGLDMRYTDFWPLIPGANEIAVNFTGEGGATKARVLSNGAWA